MTSTWLLGIDVGGTRKGIHVAARTVENPHVSWIKQFAGPKELVEHLQNEGVTPVLAAIDAPPRAWRNGAVTRLAEREICALGYRVQWTRRAGEPAPEWMEHGQSVWQTLRSAFPECRLIETFPTVASDLLSSADTVLPLSLLNGKERRATIKDYLDAVIAVDVAARVLSGRANHAGLDDPDGTIYF